MKLTDEQLINFMKASYQSRKENETRISAMLRGIKSVIAAEDAERLKDGVEVAGRISYNFTTAGPRYRFVPSGNWPEDYTTMYTSDTVSALKGRIAELEAAHKPFAEMLKSFEGKEHLLTAIKAERAKP